MSLLKNSTTYLAANILNALVPFLLLPLLTQNLIPAEYGQIAMFLTLISGLSAVTGLNTIGAASRRYYDNEGVTSIAGYNGSCVLILILSSIVILLLGTILNSYLRDILKIPSEWVLYAILISAGNFLIQFRLSQWQIREQALKFGILQVSQSIILFILTVVLLFLFNKGVDSRIDGMIIVTILFAALSVASLYKDKLINLKNANKANTIDALRFGVPLVPHILGIFFLSAIDRIIINDQLGIADAGIYMLGVQLSLGLMVVFDAINKAFIPWLYKILSQNDSIAIERIVRYTYLYFLILILIGVMSFLVGPFAIRLIASEEYNDAGKIIGWLCLGQVFTGMYLTVTNYIFYAKCTGRLSLITIGCGFLNIALMLLLIQPFGIKGVAIAFATSMLLRFLSTWWLASKVCGFSWRLIRLRT